MLFVPLAVYALITIKRPTKINLQAKAENVYSWGILSGKRDGIYMILNQKNFLYVVMLSLLKMFFCLGVWRMSMLVRILWNMGLYMRIFVILVFVMITVTLRARDCA